MRIVLDFDYHYAKGKYFFYKLFQLGGRIIFPFILIAKFNEYCRGTSFYPDCPRKSVLRIFFDQLGWILRKGELNNFYYMLGMDRIEVSRIYDYIGEITWTNVRRKKNEVKRQWKFFNASSLLLDKMYFGALLETLGYKTPHIRYFINDGSVRDLDKKEEVEFKSIFSEVDVEYFFKRAAGGGGKDVDNFVVKYQNGELWRLNKDTTIEELFKDVCKGRWIVQEKVTGQHPYMAKYHEEPINTIRLVTVIHDNTVVPIAALARFGQGGRMKDNGFSGGIIVPIDVNTGEFAGYGLMPVQKRRVSSHPNSNIPFTGKVPLWELAIEKTKALHKQFYNIHSIGWDIAFLEKDVCFIEGNDDWHVIDAQVFSPGKPIFKKYFN